MTERQRIKHMLLVGARRSHPKDQAEFRQSALGTFDCFTDPQLVAELDRIEDHSLGITKLLSEVWNAYQKELLEEETFCRWAK